MRMEAQLGLAARELRTRAGASLLDVAQLAGVSEGTVSRFEHGRAWSKSTNEIVAVYARITGVTSRDIWQAAVDLGDA